MVKKKIKQFTRNKQKPIKRAIISIRKSIFASKHIVEKENVFGDEQAEKITSKFDIGSGRTLQTFFENNGVGNEH